MSDEIKLESGATLKISVAPFLDAKALFDSCMEELKSVDVSSERDMASVIKDIACVALSSKKIEKAIMKCAERATYNGLRISFETFEDVSARRDYLEVIQKIAEKNLEPFTSALAARLSDLMGRLSAFQK